MSQRKKTSTVRLQDAFPSFFTRHDRTVFASAVVSRARGPSRLRDLWAPTGETALDEARANWTARDCARLIVRCGAMVPSTIPGVDRVCGRKLCLQISKATGFVGYTNPQCKREAHNADLSAHVIDALVEREVVARFSPAALDRWIARNWLSSADAAGRVADRQKHLDQLRARLTAARESELDARVNLDRAAINDAYDVQRKLRAQIRSAEEALERTEIEAARVRALAAHDADAIRALATDIPVLLGRAAYIPGGVARVFSALVRRVLARPVSAGVWDITLEYPTGESARHTVCTSRTRTTQAERAWIAGERICGRRDTEIAATLMALEGPVHDRSAWTADRVALTAATADEPSGPQALLWGEKARQRHRRPDRSSIVTESVEALAARVGAPIADVWRETLLGYLGDAVYDDGTLVVTTTMQLLQLRFPDYARHTVARDAGWPQADTVPTAAYIPRFGSNCIGLRAWVRAAGSTVRRDLGRRNYVRKSLVERVERDAIAHALMSAPRAWRRWAFAGWVPMPGAERCLGRRPQSNEFPTLQVDANFKAKDALRPSYLTYVWFDEQIRERMCGQASARGADCA